MKPIYVIYENYGSDFVDGTLLDGLGYFEYMDDCVEACANLNMGHNRTYGTRYSRYAVVEIDPAVVDPRQLELFN